MMMLGREVAWRGGSMGYRDGYQARDHETGLAGTGRYWVYVFWDEVRHWRRCPCR